MKKVKGMLMAVVLLLSGMLLFGFDSKASGDPLDGYSHYLSSDGKLILEQYYGKSESITVPAKAMYDGVMRETEIYKETFSQNTYIKHVKFEKGCKITNTGYRFLGGPGLFSYCSRLETVDLTGVDWSELDSAYGMFQQCTNLKSVKGGNWDNESFDIVKHMFEGCSSLESIDLSKLDTSRVSDFESMFKDCTSLKNVNVNGFNTKLAYSFANMFNGCTSLETVDLSSFEGTSLKGSAQLVGYGFDYMFTGCTNLKNIDFSPLEGAKCNALYTFQDCTSLKTVNLHGLTLYYNTYMFKNCSNLSTIYTPKEAEDGRLPNKMCEFVNGRFGSIYYDNLYGAPANSLIMVPPTRKAEGETFAYNGIKYRVTYSAVEYAKVEVIGIETGDEVVVIPDYACDENMASYYVTSIGKNAFSGNSTIKTVILPSTIEKISAKAFYKCKKLGNVVIDSRNLKTIGKNCFKKIKKKAKFTIYAQSKKKAQTVMSKLNKFGGAKNGKLKYKKAH
ncbi:leucine-rich repeat protein [Butyrivibrio sp. AD3002]|uniref:leucine-rich repeat protein n=1 Tax=Butyrivibrio sp. AD3002 TaxID=1280670 RepID=UPI0003B576CB|nr:leucine-rich repeat protein [Butyrivibrio sp. AD3002]